jgi:hypothetical protein
MNKKNLNILIIIFFSFLFSNFSYAEKVRTRYGFYVDLPENYLSLNANIDEIIKSDKDDELAINKKFFNETMSGTSKSDLEREYFFPKKKYNAEGGDIYILVQNSNIREF